MGFRFMHSNLRPLMPVLPGASTVRALISSSDVGKLIQASSNHGLLAIGTTQDISKATGFIGVLANVPTATTQLSSDLFYVSPIHYGDFIEADYSTTVAGTTSCLAVTTNIGYYFGFSNTTTVAGGSKLDPSTCGVAAGTTSGLFFKMLGFDNTRKTIWGVINSSHLAFV